MRASISVPSHKHLGRMSLFLFSLICLVWVSIYGVVITGAFSRAFWASMTAYELIHN